ncbi:MAG: pyrroloquinoline quinone-dependent dehydrogenase [Proteobacteria bacterium]|nr:pyrroloquinoline quinone-dependent dehydrogenase [Pseudomonadota bacterium]
MPRIDSILLCALICLPSCGWSWQQYGGEGGRQYVDLDQINAQNLDDLEVAWTFRTGDLNAGFKNKDHSFQANPIIWKHLLFISTSSNEVKALNSATGELVWSFDAQLPKDIGYSESASRGVSLWEGESHVCPARVYLGTLVGEIIALDALTGQPCADFGTNGRVDLSIGVGSVSTGDYSVTSPPAVLADRIIVGSAIGDNRAVDLERGIVRALDAKTGQVLWIWDPIPRDPSDPAFESWQPRSTEITGAANAWAPLTADVERGLVYVPTSSPSPDFYGGERLGDNHYANSLVALDVATGEVRWHQQTVHHDIWDYDIPSQPTLMTLDVNGTATPAVVIVTKTGMLFGFHRDSGAPLLGFEERMVPATDVPGERVSPTQPFSAIPPLSDQRALTEDDAFGIAIFDKLGCKKVLASYRSEGIFTPPSLKGTLQSPSYAGGSNWGGVAVDEERQIAVANVNQIPAQIRLIPRDQIQAEVDAGNLDDWQVSRMTGTPYFMARRIFLSALGLPCIAPPWGKLVAVDLKARQILWDVPLGSIADIAPAIVPNFEWGVPGMGGPLLTRSGLVVIGAAAEKKLRIFDAMTGDLLWDTRLPSAPMATPMSYAVDGQQYIVVAAGGHGQLGIGPDDYVIAYRLKR